MVEFRTLRFLLAAGALAVSLCACGGSDNGAAAVTAAKTASWTDVSVRALDGTVNIGWDRPSGSSLSAEAPTYNIYCSTTPDDLVQQGNRIASGYRGYSFDHTNVTAGVRYYYAVTEVTAGVEGPASRPVSAIPQAALPASPNPPRATAGDAAVKLDFAGPTPTGTATVTYNVYRSTTRGSFTAANLPASNKPVSALSPYTDENLANGATYYYSVTAVIDGRESRFSPAVSACPTATVAAVASGPTQLASFASPTEMSVEAANASCLVRWTDVANLSLTGHDPATNPVPYYILYWSDSPDVIGNARGHMDNPVKDAAGAVKVSTGMVNGAMYYFQVVAAVRGSDGTPIPGRFTAGPVVSATPYLKTAAAPGGLAATQGTQQVLLTWNRDASGQQGVLYNVYFSTTNAATAAELRATGTKRNNDDSSKTYYSHTGLDEGSTYYYVVTSVVPGEGESAPSSIVSVAL